MSRCMRTTLTIDDDVAAELHRLRRTRDVGLKEVVNDVLRRGLRDMTSAPKRKKAFRTQPLDSGRLLVASVDNVAELLAEVEGEAFR
jgi:Arc/MetJ family transcription regulator